jgi:hypothetical protein
MPSFTAQGGITLEGRLLEETPAGYLLRFVVTDHRASLPTSSAGCSIRSSRQTIR